MRDWAHVESVEVLVDVLEGACLLETEEFSLEENVVEEAFYDTFIQYQHDF